MCKKIVIMDITPEWAKITLSKNNTNNRNISKKRVAMLAEEMEKGTFQDNGDTIRFSADGTLLDGQHRIAAVAKSGITLKNAIVVFGLDSDAFKTIDSGRSRTNADRLKMLGCPSSVQLASAAKMYIQYMSGDLLFNTPVSNTLIVETGKENETLFKYGLSVHDRLKKQGLRPQAGIIPLISLCYKYDSDKTKEFVSGLVSGANLDKGDARLALRSALIRRPNNTWWDKSIFVQYVIKAINAFMNDEKVVLIRFSSGDKYQELFFTNVINEQARKRLDEVSKNNKLKFATKEDG